MENVIIATKLHSRKRITSFSVNSRENSHPLPQIAVFNLCQAVRRKVVSDFAFVKGQIRV